MSVVFKKSRQRSLFAMTIWARPIRLFWADTDVFHCRYFCITQTTVERHYFTAMKNRTASNSAQNWVIKTVNHTYPEMFAGSHLLTAQANEFHVIKGLLGRLRHGLYQCCHC